MGMVDNIECRNINKKHIKLNFRGQGVNFTNILSAAFAPVFLRQKSTELKCNDTKVVYETFEQNFGEIDSRAVTNEV
jgi:hypothetical protein